MWLRWEKNCLKCFELHLTGNSHLGAVRTPKPLIVWQGLALRWEMEIPQTENNQKSHICKNTTWPQKLSFSPFAVDVETPDTFANFIESKPSATYFHTINHWSAALPLLQLSFTSIGSILVVLCLKFLHGSGRDLLWNFHDHFLGAFFPRSWILNQRLSSSCQPGGTTPGWTERPIYCDNIVESERKLKEKSFHCSYNDKSRKFQRNQEPKKFIFKSPCVSIKFKPKMVAICSNETISIIAHWAKYPTS